MKVSEGGLLLERLAVEEQGAFPTVLPLCLSEGPGYADADDGRVIGTWKGLAEPGDSTFCPCNALEGW